MDGGINYFFLKKKRGDKYLQSITIILKSKGPYQILWDIRASTYQICRIEEKINRTATFHKRV